MGPSSIGLRGSGTAAPTCQLQPKPEGIDTIRGVEGRITRLLGFQSAELCELSNLVDFATERMHGPVPSSPSPPDKTVSVSCGLVSQTHMLEEQATLRQGLLQKLSALLGVREKGEA
jgi:hypothetical protein